MRTLEVDSNFHIIINMPLKTRAMLAVANFLPLFRVGLPFGWPNSVRPRVGSIQEYSLLCRASNPETSPLLTKTCSTPDAPSHIFALSTTKGLPRYPGIVAFLLSIASIVVFLCAMREKRASS